MRMRGILYAHLGGRGGEGGPMGVLWAWKL